MESTIKDLNILLLVEGLISEVTPAYLERISQQLRPAPEGANRIGTTTDLKMQTLWAASFLAEARAAELLGRAGAEETDQSAEDLKREALWLSELGVLMQNLFYAQLRRDCGTSCGLSVTQGWILVEHQRNPLLGLLGL